MIHLRAGEQGAIGHRRHGNAGAGTDMAHLAGLRHRNMVRRKTGHLEVNRRNRIGRRSRPVALRAIGRLARRVGVDIQHRRHDREVTARVLMAARATRTRGHWDMVRRLFRCCEISKIGAVAVDTLAGRRVLRILNHEFAADRTGSSLEAHVLRGWIRRHRGWIQRVLTHGHPGITAFMTARAVTRHTAMNLVGGRCWIQEQRPWRKRGRIRRNEACRQ